MSTDKVRQSLFNEMISLLNIDFDLAVKKFIDPSETAGRCTSFWSKSNVEQLNVLYSVHF